MLPCRASYSAGRLLKRASPPSLNRHVLHRAWLMHRERPHIPHLSRHKASLLDLKRYGDMSAELTGRWPSLMPFSRMTFRIPCRMASPSPPPLGSPARVMRASWRAMGSLLLRACIPRMTFKYDLQHHHQTELANTPLQQSFNAARRITRLSLCQGDRQVQGLALSIRRGRHPIGQDYILAEAHTLSAMRCAIVFCTWAMSLDW